MKKMLLAAAASLAMAAPAFAADEALAAAVAADYPYVFELYKHFHQNPELSFRESASAARMATELKALGFTVTTGVGDAFRAGLDGDRIHALCQIDHWFLDQIDALVRAEQALGDEGLGALDARRLSELKRQGFADSRLAELVGTNEAAIRHLRHTLGLQPVYKRVDSCAGEFATSTAYLYSTYADECEAAPSERQKSALSAELTVAITRAPSALPSWMAAEPELPAPPNTSSVSPAASWPRWTTPT